MEQYLAALTQGLADVFMWPAFGYLMIGIVCGMLLGLLPGLSGLQGLAILLPFAFDKTPTEALALLLGAYTVTTMTDTIPAILIGVPGSATAQASVLDGHPMAKQGQAGRALAASYMANIMGAVWAGLVFIVAIPIVTPLIMAFGIPEYFMLALLGLSMVGALSGRSVLKGVIMAGVGLLLSMVGLATHTGQPRFTFDVLYLWNGLPLVPAVLGLFGLPEVVDMAVKRSSISRVPIDPYKGTLAGIRDAFRDWALVARCSFIGAWVGFLPAMGGPVAEWFGYGHAVQTTSDKDSFGKGNVRGVLGPEAATAGQKPGALIPTIAFAIPGNVSMAILLGAFMIVGIRPGVDMLTVHLPLTFSMMWFIVVANIISAVLILVVSRQLVSLTAIDAATFVPFILAFMMIAAVVNSGHFLDLVTFVGFGLLGWALRKGNWPVPPLVLGMVLGALMETYLLMAWEIYELSWLWRPFVVAIWVLIGAALVWGHFQGRGARRQGQAIPRATAQSAQGL